MIEKVPSVELSAMLDVRRSVPAAQSVLLARHILLPSLQKEISVATAASVADTRKTCRCLGFDGVMCCVSLS
jgi:hypothetical protein